MQTAIKETKPMDRLLDAGNLILLLLFAFTCLYPFYYIFIYSVSDPTAAIKGVYFVPKGFTWVNYKAIFAQSNIVMAAFVSIARSAVGTVVTVFFTSMFAYLVAQPKLRFRKFFYRLVLFSMYVNAGLIPWYILMMSLGFKNSFLLYVVPSAIHCFYLILVKTYIEQLPPALQESAMIDGAGPFKIFIRIILPLCTPVLATIAIFSAVDQWNAWVDNFYLVSSPKLQTLQMLLLTYMQNSANQANEVALRGALLAHKTPTPFSIKMTITMIATIPILFVYPMFQRYFVKGIMMGAVKG